MNEYFTVGCSINAVAHKKMNNKMTKKLWSSFTFDESSIEIEPCDDYILKVGSVDVPVLDNDKEYALCVNQNGFAIVGRDYGGLMRGFFCLLMKIELENKILITKNAPEQSNYLLKNRMIHICVFPENDLYYIKKLIRLSALCQYTHIVIEFWGMFKYDCLKELSWPHAFTKDEIKSLIDECHELGIEPIPMLNQLGHATASRACYGKHVVLDQNPKLRHLFTPDGWAWNIESDEVTELMRKMRGELYEVFGKGEYMHIGCDEAYYISKSENLRKQLPDYLKSLTHMVEKEGRRPMIWMDMFLEKDAFKDCYTTGEKDEVEIIRNSTAKSTVFVDWQYNAKEVPVPSLVSLKDCARDVMGAPWFDAQNYEAHIKTIKDNNFFGIMLTTWNTLKLKLPHILYCAKKLGVQTFTWSEKSSFAEIATIMRRVSLEGNTYEDSGWAKNQIEV